MSGNKFNTDIIGLLYSYIRKHKINLPAFYKMFSLVKMSCFLQHGFVMFFCKHIYFANVTNVLHGLIDCFDCPRTFQIKCI